MCFSSHSAANGVIASAVNFCAISWIWRWSSVRSNWVMALPLAAAGRSSQPLGLEHGPDGLALLHAPAEGGKIGPAREVDAEFPGPPEHCEQVGIGDAH